MKIYDTSGNELTERPNYEKGRILQDPNDPDRYIYTTWEEVPAGEGNGESGKKSKTEKLEELDAQYDADKAEILRYFSEAQFAGDAELMEELRAEMEAIDAKYIEDRRAIEEGSEE